jgi:ABC-2 type transport system ATP-binding protein
MDQATRRRRIDDVVERLQLAGVLTQPIETLSKGFKRRVGLAQAILHDPQALILDEPTDGLDPNQKHEVRALIRSMARDKIIVISTHILEEVHAVCTRAVIIARGKLLADATPAQLEARSRYHGAVSLTTENPLAVRDALARVDGVAAVEIDAQDGRMTAFPRSGAAIYEKVAEFLRQQRVTFSELQLEQGRLDEVFRQITTQGQEVRA